MQWNVATAFLVVVALGVACADPYPYFTCYKHEGNGTYYVDNTKDESGIALAKYENAIFRTGWAFLTLTSNTAFDDYEQMYAAGFLEGAITVDLIWTYYLDIFAGEYNHTKMTSEVEDWITDNIAFMNSQVKANPADPYWTHISLILTQLAGMVDGYNTYNKNTSQALTMMDFFLINMDGDMDDLMAALNATSVDWSDDRSVIENYIYNTHCSSIVKVADDFSDLFAGHTTWSGFYEMIRIFKTYDLPISVKQSSGVHMFSSYPGALSSVDDFYQTDSGLVVMETTNGIMNFSLYDAVTPNSVLSFIRVIVANKMAADGKDWVNIFSQYNSGTYNNQWIIVDTNKLVTGSHLEPGTLWILEQIPGYIESADVTQTLSYGYWPSYNVPYFENIYNISGFPKFAALYGTFFTYENNPRAEIFRRDAGNVDSLATIGDILRYNDYKHDRLAHGNPGYAISSRFDLVTSDNSSNPFLAKAAFGGIDSKVTSATSVKSMECAIQSGPSHDNVPPFEWSEEWSDVVHLGMPRVWDFGWVVARYEKL